MCWMITSGYKCIPTTYTTFFFFDTTITMNATNRAATTNTHTAVMAATVEKDDE